MDGARYRSPGAFAPPCLCPAAKSSAEPWRLAASVLHELGRTDEISLRWPEQAQARALQSWLQQQGASPHPGTSSLGRLFDAVAAFAGKLATLSDHEAHAAMLLETSATSAWPVSGFSPNSIVASNLGEWDWRPMMQSLIQASNTEQGGIRPPRHADLAHGLAQWASQTCLKRGLNTVVLTGGCLVNRLLDDLLTGLSDTRPASLAASQYPLWRWRSVSGQAWVALQTPLPSPAC